MKRVVKLIYIFMLLIVISFFIKTPITFGVERFVDIPVPPNSSGYADFSPEDGEKKEKQIQEQQLKDKNTVDELKLESNNIYNENKGENTSIEKENKVIENIQSNNEGKGFVFENIDKKIIIILIIVCVLFIFGVAISKGKKHGKH